MRTFSEWLKVRNPELDRDSWPAFMAWRDLTKRQSRFTKDAEEEAIDNLNKEDARDQVKKMLSELSDQERKIIKLRWGIDHEPLTLAQIGKMLGISAGYVSYIEQRALHLLKVLFRKEKLQKAIAYQYNLDQPLAAT